MYKTQQIRLTESISDAAWDYLVWHLRQSNSLQNCVTFAIRQAHFERMEPATWYDHCGNCRSGHKLSRVRANYRELAAQFKTNPHYQAIGGQQAQQAIKSVCESFASYNKLLPLWFAGELDVKPEMPGYRKSGGLSELSIPAQALRWDLASGCCRLPISNECRSDWQDIGAELWLPGGDGFDPMTVAELRIVPRNGELYAEYVYQSGNAGPTCNLDLAHQQALGVDHGLGNWLTCVTTTGKSFIIDGHRLKSQNQWYNKRVAILKKGKPEAYWDDNLASLTEKRNRQMRDAVNKAARFVVNWCLQNRVGRIVFGWNPRQKDGLNIGKRNTQSFVQIPTARLKQRLKELCEEVGIQFEEVEESYTSQASFLSQ
ncbi:MAG: RNA-guided endonuclease InsQ/TnpB family protein, partial [Leptolyngbyaceae cyanobacterium]